MTYGKILLTARLLVTTSAFVAMIAAPAYATMNGGVRGEATHQYQAVSPGLGGYWTTMQTAPRNNPQYTPGPSWGPNHNPFTGGSPLNGLGGNGEPR